jgi:hypothetical protein
MDIQMVHCYIHLVEVGHGDFSVSPFHSGRSSLSYFLELERLPPLFRELWDTLEL